VVSTTVWWSAQACSRRCASSSTGGLRREPRTRKPVAAAQNPPTSQRTFFIEMPPLCNLTFVFWYYDAPGWLDAVKLWCVAGLLQELSQARRERLHFGYGFGSIWTGAGNWSAFSCEDDGVGGGCGDFSESFGWGKGKTECECGSGFECCFGFYSAFG